MVYSNCLLERGLDSSLLLSAAADLADWACAGSWDAQSEAYLLGAARARIIAGDLVSAGGCLQERGRWKWHRTEAEILGRVVGSVGEPSLISETKLYGDLVSFLDRVRDPEFRPGAFFEDYILPLEFGVITSASCLGNMATVDWSEVVDSVSN
jgi:hypothetical protein